MVCQNFIQKLKSCPPRVTANGCIFLSLIIGKGFSGDHPLLTSTTALTPKFEFTLGGCKAKYLTTNQATEPVFITSASSSAHHKAITSSTSTNKKRIPHTKIITTTGGQFTCTPPLIPSPPYNTLLTTPSQGSTGCCCLHHPLVSVPTAQPQVAGV